MSVGLTQSQSGDKFGGEGLRTGGGRGLRKSTLEAELLVQPPPALLSMPSVSAVCASAAYSATQLAMGIVLASLSPVMLASDQNQKLLMKYLEGQPDWWVDT